MQTILEKACQTLAGDQNMAAAGYNNNGNKVIGNTSGGIGMNMNMSMNINASSSSTSHLDQPPPTHRMLLPGDHVPSAIKDFGSLNFPSFQDLNLYGTSPSPSPPAVAAAGGALLHH